MWSAVPWLLVVAGWIIVSRQNDFRERRKDVRELIKSLTEKLEQILDNWSSYNLLDGSDPKAAAFAAKIKSDISSLQLFMRRINQAGLTFDGSHHIVSLRQRATGGEFESLGRTPSANSHDEYAMLGLIVMDFIRDIEASYFSTYKLGLKSWIDMDSAFSYFIRNRGRKWGA